MGMIKTHICLVSLLVVSLYTVTFVGIRIQQSITFFLKIESSAQRCINFESHQLRQVLAKWDQTARRANISYFLTDDSLMEAYLTEKPLECGRNLEIMINREHMKRMLKTNTKNKRNENQNSATTSEIELIIHKDWNETHHTKRRRFNCYDKQVDFEDDLCSFKKPLARLIIKKKNYLDIFSYIIEKGQVRNLHQNKRMDGKHIFPLKNCEMLGIDTFCPRNTARYLQLHKLPSNLK